jgi:hypothetical protein
MPAMTLKDIKIDTKFICNLCGKRHKISPHRIDQDFLRHLTEKVDASTAATTILQADALPSNILML